MSEATLEKLMASMRRSKGFPTLETTANAVLGSLIGAKSQTADVSTTIVEDFALTQKVLQLANSPMYAPFAQGSDSVSSAMQVLGQDALLHLVLGTELVTQDELATDPNLSRSKVAAELARNALGDRAEEASIATYMCDLGRMLVGQYLPGDMRAIDAQVDAGVTLDAASRAVLGMTLEQLGLEVARLWNLPLPILSTMDGTGDPSLVGVARFSNLASGLLHQGAAEDAQKLISSLNIPGVDKSRLAHLVEQKAVTVKVRAPGLGQPAQPAQPRQPRQPLGLAGAAAVGPGPASAVSAGDQAVSEKVPEKATLATGSAEKSMRDLFGKLTQQRIESVDDLANTMFPALGVSLQTSHSLLFMLTRSGEFAVRNGFGKAIDTIKGRLRISAEFKPTAFHAVVRNNVDVSISDVSKLKPTALPEHFRELFPKTVQFVILPVGTARATGLMYCGWEIQKPLTQEEMQALKQLRDLFVPFFPR